MYWFIISVFSGVGIPIIAHYIENLLIKWGNNDILTIILQQGNQTEENGWILLVSGGILWQNWFPIDQKVNKIKMI